MALTATSQQTRPQPVVLAVALSAINGAGGILFAAIWPDLDERATTLVVSCILGTIMLSSAWLLWGANRWGAIATIAVQAFNIVLGVPAYFMGEDAGIIIGSTISIVLSVATVALVLSAGARAFWGAGEGRAVP